MTHELSCNKRLVSCRHCHIMMTYELLSSHDNVCPSAIVACEYGSYGCDYFGARDTMDEHDNNFGAVHARMVNPILFLLCHSMSNYR
jgi:hypothetical protein